MKAVSGSSWGHDKDTLLLTYKALVASVFNFGAAIDYPNCKPTNIACFQVLQNAALLLATGCHKAATVAYLHGEAKMLLVAEHLSVLCTQFLASCMRSEHPSYAVVQIPPGPRKNAKERPLKETLFSRFGDALGTLFQALCTTKSRRKFVPKL
jgi:hypothetical protein